MGQSLRLNSLKYKLMLKKTFIALSLAVLYCTVALAQSRRNEFSLGQVAGYFFDSTGVKLYNLKTESKQYGFNLSMNYTRHLNDRWSLSNTAMLAVFRYYDYGRNYGLGKVPNFSVLHRLIFRLAPQVERRFTFGPTSLRLGGGPNLVIGDKFNHYIFIDKITWVESVREGVAFGLIGISAGGSLQHPIYKRIFGMFGAQYLRMLKANGGRTTYSSTIESILDPNQLYISYHIGFRF